jgi:putative DNA primase/helicase
MDGNENPRDAIEQFRAAMRAHDLNPPEIIEPGKLHRFPTNGKRHDDAGWCKLFADGGGGVFGDFRSGLSETWQAQRDKPFTSAEREAFRQRCEAERRARETEEARRHADAREKAAAILEGATGDTASHPYAIKKSVPFGPLVKRGLWPQRGWTDALLVPIYGGDGGLWSIGAINTGGDKDFLAGGKTGGGFHPFAKVRGADRVLIGEGLASVASCVAAESSPGVAALYASNLKAVALAVRELAPGAEIIVIADNDVEPDGGNRGLKAAEEAAAAVGGRVALPGLEGRKCDMWDLWAECGPEAVRRAIAGAEGPAGDEHSPGGASPVGNATDSTKIIALEIGELIARTFTPKTSILSPWLRRQDLAMIYSKRGVGKTHLCLALAYAIASGGKFLKWQAPEPRRVLYVDGEMPGVAIQERLAALVDANEKEPPEGFFRIVTPDVQSFSPPDLATPEGQAALQPLLGEAEVIVLDNLSVLVRAGVENEGESWIPMATWALARRREGRSVVFVHHAGKGGQQRGSSRREDLLDTVICLKHPSDYTPEQGARFEMVFEKGRGLYGADVEAVEAALKRDAGGKASWTWKAAEGSTADRISELQKLGMKPAEIASELGIHRSNVYRAINSRNGGTP